MYTTCVHLLSYTSQQITEAMEESKEIEKIIQKDEFGGVER